MSATTMRCAYCNREKHRDGFPSSRFAQCWECAWDSHIHDAHPAIVRRIRRAAKKRARRLGERELTAAMFENERRQYLGLPEPTGADR